jgi:hypothetical protein
MTIEEDFFAAATAGSPTVRVYPEVLPQAGSILPAATFTVVGGSDDMHLAGKSNTGFRLFQVDTWASSRLGADNLMDDIQTRILAAAAFVVVGIDVSGAPRYEEETKRYRASKEFTVRFA